MTSDLLDATAVTAAADLGARASTAGVINLADGPDLLANIVNDDQRVEVVDLESHEPRPRSHRGQAVLHDPGSFAAYVQRLHKGETTVWANATTPELVAVFNDHTGGAANWRDHRAHLRVARDPDWSAWLNADGQYTGQVEFCEHLEDLLHTIADPPAGQLLDAIGTFSLRREGPTARCGSPTGWSDPTPSSGTCSK